MDKNGNPIKTAKARNSKSIDTISPCSFELMDKWRLYFKFLDQNNDRVINSDDLANLSMNVMKLFPGRKALTVKIKEAFFGWWNLFKLHVGSTRNACTESEFVNALKYIYETKRVILESQVKTMFDVVDLDKSGLVSRREYVQLFSSAGAVNENYVGRVFDRINVARTGLLTRKVFQDAFTDFFLKNDNSMAFLFKFPY